MGIKKMPYVQKQNRSYLKFILKIIICLTFIILSRNGIAQTLSKSDTSNVKFLNSRKFYIYKVEKGETLFNISQKFKIPQEEIIQFNHEIQKNGLKAKMKIWIPAYSWLKKDSVESKVEITETPKKNKYIIAIVTSLNLPRIYLSNDSTGSDIEEPLKKEVKENLEFVEGILFASEKFKANGIKIHLYIIDAENDSMKVVNKLKKINDIDLIITNETGNVLRSVSKISANSNLKLISYGVNTTEIIRDNKNAFSMIPSSSKQCELAGYFSGKYFQNASLLAVKSNNAKENERTEHFREGWLNSKGGAINQVNYNKDNSDEITNALDKKKHNIVFISSSNEDMVTSVLSTIQLKIPEYKISVVGIPTWQFFETVDQKIMEACDVYLFSSSFIDYNNDSVLTLRKYFREKYNMEPGEFSYQGYDALLFSGKSLLVNGIKIFDENNPASVEGLYTDYLFPSKQTGKALENQIIHFYQPWKEVSVDLVKNLPEK
jgi:hypothetical protein